VPGEVRPLSRRAFGSPASPRSAERGAELVSASYRPARNMARAHLEPRPICTSPAKRERWAPQVPGERPAPLPPSLRLAGLSPLRGERRRARLCQLRARAEHGAGPPRTKADLHLAREAGEVGTAGARRGPAPLPPSLRLAGLSPLRGERRRARLCQLRARAEHGAGPPRTKADLYLAREAGEVGTAGARRGSRPSPAEPSARRPLPAPRREAQSPSLPATGPRGTWRGPTPLSR
jgi:hypothetical protein